MSHRERVIARCPAERLGKQMFDELAQQSASQNSGPPSAKAPGAPSDLPNEGVRTPEPNLGTVLYLISLGVVAIATVVVFFGLGFFLLPHPDEELIAAARDRGAEVAPRSRTYARRVAPSSVSSPISGARKWSLRAAISTGWRAPSSGWRSVRWCCRWSRAKPRPMQGVSGLDRRCCSSGCGMRSAAAQC
jgi:hypothetical protein